MSYDISLEIDTGGPEAACVGDWNITYNVRPMCEAAGLRIWALQGASAREAGLLVRAAIGRLLADPEAFRPLEPGNGWGSYIDLLGALPILAELCERHPKAIVRVS